jgi:putative transposase
VAAFIAAQREQHRVPHATACRALAVSPAWFYKWRDGDASPRHARRAQLAAEITRLFAAHHGRYGSPRITADLHEAGWRVSENTVAKIMREQQLVARARKRHKQSTRQGKGRWRAPDLIGRDFPAARLNQKWFGDGTEIATDEGSSPWPRCWTSPRGASSASPSVRITTRSWLTARWRWRPPSAAGRTRSPG